MSVTYLPLSERAELAHEIFAAKCQAWCAAWREGHDDPPSPEAVLYARAQLYADARVEAGLPRLTSWQAYMAKLDKRRARRTASGRRRP